MSLWDGFGHIVREAEPLAPYTWFRLGGTADFFVEPTSIDELGAVVRRCREQDVPVRLLGGGSNLLVQDAGVAGAVIHLSAPEFSRIAIDGRRVVAGGGTKLAHLISTSVREGLGGLDQLVGIPGTVGGALHNNSSTPSGDIGQWTRQATVMTRSGEILTRKRDDLRFAHRSSSLDELAIVEAEFELEEDDPLRLTKHMQKLWIMKKGTQPLSSEATGCIFKDPGGISAAELIEQAGLKGARVGEAEVSSRNVNFIVAHPGARATDVLKLVELMTARVAERLGVDLERQIEVW